MGSRRHKSYRRSKEGAEESGAAVQPRRSSRRKSGGGKRKVSGGRSSSSKHGSRSRSSHSRQGSSVRHESSHKSSSSGRKGKKKAKKAKVKRSRRGAPDGLPLAPKVATRRSTRTIPVDGLPVGKVEGEHPLPATVIKQHDFLTWHPTQQTDLNTTSTFTFTKTIPPNQMWR